ncbi:SBBP repeat-containing protein [Bacillus cereus]|uniref:DUF7948 domain-containing protein n=1 Tax=Bacillus cereus TaxID=1396 RepID=UPI00123C054B|nr:SBBP repeat-containing protein [Bacillus cereus]KAA6479396.1 hypothetical protein DX931_13880 [Bacillus cereus]
MSATKIQQVVPKNYRDLPFTFIPNVGQMHSKVQYYSQVTGKGLYFTSEEVVFSFIENTYPDPFKFREEDAPKTEQVRRGMAFALHFFNANPDVRIEGQAEGDGKIHYLQGNDPAKWTRNLSTYEKIVYRNLWSGIDLIFRGKSGQLKYEFVVQPGANIQDISLTYRGADGLSLDDEGNLQIKTPYGVLIDDRPISYQEINGNQVAVTSSFKMGEQKKGESGYGFEIGNSYDSQYPLIIDPGLVFSTYLGGNGLRDEGFDIAIDAKGHAYVTGVASTNFPTTLGAFDTSFNGGVIDAFVTKFKADGSGLIYSTYLGGSGADAGTGIAIDAKGHAYVIGETGSTNFPTSLGAFDTTYNGGLSDAFVTKLKVDGSGLVYSTYLGGNGLDQGTGIVIDAKDHAYVTGSTSSTNFPTTPEAFDTTYNGGNLDVFVTKLKTDGSGLVYSTYLGGSGQDTSGGISLDVKGHAYVSGFTLSPNFPTTPGAFDTSFNGGVVDAFVTKLKTDGSDLVYSTYLGGSGSDFGSGIAVDAKGQAHVTGYTTSPNFPATPGAFDTSYNGRGDGFVTKLKADGSGLVYSTYLGGSENDLSNGIAIDYAGYVYVTGFTLSPNFPTTPGAFDTSFNGGPFTSDAFVTKFKVDGSGLVYSTYLGGSKINSLGGSNGRNIVVDCVGNAYVTGSTDSTDFPTTPGAFDTTYNGGTSDAFVTKISTNECPIPNQPTCCKVTSKFKTKLVPFALASKGVTTEVFFYNSLLWKVFAMKKSSFAGQ